MNIRGLRGMPLQAPLVRQYYRLAEDTAARVLDSYGYQETGLPVLESTELFARAVGESTDLVEKEMYTFDDRNGVSLTLRPEGTAGCVRAAEEMGLLFNQVQRLWYRGPMFRYEKPQKGRYRQFEQIGAECFGMPGPDVDAELLLLGARLWRELGLADLIRLELNSLGSVAARQAYRQALVDYLRPFEEELDPDSRRRLQTNPLRILDSKILRTRELLQDAPRLDAFYDEASQQHFDGLRRLLDKAGQAYEINTSIVRGLDYYNQTVFEWTTEALGAQSAVCSGGRYDGLAAELGSRPVPGVGFALGLDRLVLLLQEKADKASGSEWIAPVQVYLVSVGSAARSAALLLGEKLRTQLPGLRLLLDCSPAKLKSQMKRADKSGAEIALILGEDELAAGQVGVKWLRSRAEQKSVAEEALAACLRKSLGI